jgi:CSLREA domain-containing protein
LLLAVGFLAFMPASGAEQQGTFVVNSTGDDIDANSGDGICATAMGSCTLRAAITEANRHAGADTVAFDIPGGGVNTIKLTGVLLPLTDTTGPTTIYGYTQPGSSPNTDPLSSNAKIMVQIEGGGTDMFGGLGIESPGNVVRGLAFYGLRGR